MYYHMNTYHFTEKLEHNSLHWKTWTQRWEISRSVWLHVICSSFQLNIVFLETITKKYAINNLDLLDQLDGGKYCYRTGLTIVVITHLLCCREWWKHCKIFFYFKHVIRRRNKLMIQTPSSLKLPKDVGNGHDPL